MQWTINCEIPKFESISPVVFSRIEPFSVINNSNNKNPQQNKPVDLLPAAYGIWLQLTSNKQQTR
jgi:hypothetical protein